MSLKDIWELIKQTFAEWSEDKAPRLGAALAYYAIFSLAPLLVIVVGVVGWFYSGDTVGQIQRQISGLVGAEAAATIAEIINNANDTPSQGIAATLIGLASLLLGASGVFGQLQDALNTIWEVAPDPKRGIMGMVKDRFFSFTMVLGVAFLLLISLILSAGVSAMGAFFEHLLPGSAVLWHIIEFAVSFGLTTLLFAAIFRIVPDVEIAWSDVWIGAVVTALLFTVGKIGIGLYLGSSSVGSAYGAAGTLLVILVWIYYSSQILFLGAEFTQVYANKYGTHLQPSKGAVPLTEQARAQQGMARPEQVAAAKAGKPVPGRQPAPRPNAPAPRRREERQPAPRQKVINGDSTLVGLAGLFLGFIVGRVRNLTRR